MTRLKTGSYVLGHAVVEKGCSTVYEGVKMFGQHCATGVVARGCWVHTLKYPNVDSELKAVKLSASSCSTYTWMASTESEMNRCGSPVAAWLAELSAICCQHESRAGTKSRAGTMVEFC